MIFSYNGYNHQAYSVSFNLHRRQVLSRVQRRFYQQWLWSLRGRIRGTDASDLTTKIQAMEAAYVDGGNIIVYLPDGTTSSAHGLSNSATINGVRVMGGINWLQGTPETGYGRTEYATMRSFAITLQAEVLNQESSGSNILEFHESITYSGGFGDYSTQDAFTGLPVSYQIKQFSKQIVIQEGVVVGSHTWLSIPAPLFGSYRSPLSYVRRSSPEMFGKNVNLGFATKYRYWFELPAAVFADPNVPSLP